MNLAKYCKENGMDKEKYQSLKKIVEQCSEFMLLSIKANYKPGTGVYYSVDEIFDKECTEDFIHFVIVELKKMGVEFIENDTLWRY